MFVVEYVVDLDDSVLALILRWRAAEEVVGGPGCAMNFAGKQRVVNIQHHWIDRNVVLRENCLRLIDPGLRWDRGADGVALYELLPFEGKEEERLVFPDGAAQRKPFMLIP